MSVFDQNPAQDFNPLELAVLHWMKNHGQDQNLTLQIDSAKFIGRRWTKVGYYTDLEVPKHLPAVDLINIGGHWPVGGPNIQSPDIHNGGGSILWSEDGYITRLEMYCLGDYFNEVVEEFTLSD
jgi:hypothetical protein